jgi:hypothetical protein
MQIETKRFVKIARDRRLAINAHHESPWKFYNVKEYRFESTWKEIWVLARLLLILNGEDKYCGTLTIYIIFLTGLLQHR